MFVAGGWWCGRNPVLGVCAGRGGGMDHASPLATDTAEVTGHDSLAPCLRPHEKFAWRVQRTVVMCAVFPVMDSASHSTYPWGGQPRRSRHAHWYSIVMRS